MEWGLNTISNVLLGIFVLSCFGWLKYRSDASDARKQAFRFLAVCIALIASTGFDTISRIASPRAEVNGTVIDSYASSSRFDDSYFRIRTDSDQIVRLATVNSVARSIEVSQKVDVVYESWSGHPLSVTIRSGTTRTPVVAQEADGLSGFETLVLLLSLATAIWSIIRIRQFPE